MIKLLLPILGCAILLTTSNAYSQELAVDADENHEPQEAISAEPVDPPIVQTDEALWEEISANFSLESLGEYLAKFPNGKYADDAQSKFQELEEKARLRAKRDKELDAYRKRRTIGGILLQLDGKLTDVKPYVRSTLNSCGYILIEPHRFAKRVYPTIVFNGQIYNSKSDGEHIVNLDLSLVLKTTTREIKAREKMRSYRTSEIDTHQALTAAFEDIGAQMKSGGFCR